MRTKQVNRYYCDHCNKGSLTKSSMVQHEARCARNPGRICGFCKEAGVTQSPTEFLITGLQTGGLDRLRVVANGCPACILAAILQERALHPEGEVEWIEGFDYKQEAAAWRQECQEPMPLRP